MQKKIKTYYPFLFLVLIGAYYIYKAHFFAIHDFANYYYAAMFLEGGAFDINIYDPTWFNHKMSLHSSEIFGAYAPNTPFLALTFVPFTYISIATAKIIFNSISLILFVVSLYRLFTYHRINFNFIFGILLVFFVPIKNNILFGQVYFLLFFLIAEGFLAYKKNQHFKLSILWSLSILLKVFPILLFILLILQKRWKSFFYLGSTLFILILVSVFINGSNTWLFYLQEILPKASDGEISGEFVKNYQSFLMFFKHFFIESALNKNVVFPSDLSFQAAMIAIKLMVITFGIFRTIKSNSNLERISFWVIAFYLLSPYSSSYGSLLLIIPLIFIVKKYSWKHIFIASILIFIYASVPYNIFKSSNLILSFFKLFSLVLFFYLFFIMKKTSRKIQLSTLGLSLVVAFGISWIQNPKTQKTKTIALSDARIPFVMDHRIENDTLNYTYWSEKGLMKQRTDIRVFNVNTNDVRIINNDIYIKDKLKTLPKSSKKHALIINNNTLIYLSDLGRGYGFYRLIKVSL